MMNNMVELVSWFQLEYPELVAQMKDTNHHYTKGDSYRLFMKHLENCPEDFFRHDEFFQFESLNPYHLESDVFTHTMMVCKQAETATYLVKIAALLHDIGKPSTRKVNAENGRVSFLNHDAVSAFMSLEILKREELGLSKKQIAHIFNLIALHTQIYKLTPEQLKEIGNKELVTDLIELGKADHAGRFHTAGDTVIPEINDVFGEVLSGVSSTKRGGHYSTKEKEVIVLVGLPASGKSSYTKGFKSVTNKTFVISRDRIVMAQFPEESYNEAWKACDQGEVNSKLDMSFKEAKKEDLVIIDMTHMSKKSRRKSLSHFDSSYKKKAVVFLTDLETNMLRNNQRCGKVIDKEVIDKMIRSFYPPTLEEFDEIEYIIN